MSRCRAKFCQDDVVNDNNIFCSYHWDILPAASKEKISYAYGKEIWLDTLAIVIQELIVAEGDHLSFSMEAPPVGYSSDNIPEPGLPNKRPSAQNIIPQPKIPPKRIRGIKKFLDEEQPE